MFPCMKISCTFCWHPVPQILSLENRKSQTNEEKRKHFACSTFRMDSITFKKFICYIV